MKKIVSVLLLMIFQLALSNAQEYPEDTLNKWTSSKNDSLKSIAYNHLCRRAIFIKPDSGEKIAIKSLEAARKYGSKDLESRALISIGVSYGVRNDFKSALNYFLDALKLAEEIKDSAGISSITGNIGVIYKELNQQEKAIEYFDKSINIEHLRGAINSPYIASGMANKGQILNELGDLVGAINITNQAISRYITLNELRGLSRAYQSLGMFYDEINQIDSSITYYNKSIEIKSKTNDIEGLISTYNNLGGIYLRIKEVNKAEKVCLKSYKLLNELNTISKKADCSSCLAKVYFSKNDFKKAYYYLQESKDLSDSIFNESTIQEITETNMKYEMDKQHLRDSLITASHDAINKKTIENQELKTEKRNIWILAITIAFLLSCISIYFLFKSNKFKQKTNEMISEQNEELNQQNEEILSQRDEIERQRKILEYKNIEIKDSIKAAERIQNAFFTYEENISSFLPEHFIFFKPLDIVSGDFYWMHKVENSIYLAVVDCTGHGIPGAFMSLLGASLLNEIVSSNTNISPSEILNLLREKIIKELKQKSDIESGKEGMDISMIYLNKDTNEIEFSGANNPLYIIRKNSEEVEIIKGHREAIGYTFSPSPFPNHKIHLNSGDQIYLFSDGYADQFGGEKNKKFGYNNLRKLLIKIKGMSCSEQLQHIDNNFKNWIASGKDEQIDDVCMIGVKI